MATLGPTTTDDRRPFETTEDRFRVTYEVDFEDERDLANDFTVDITDRFGLVESDSTDVDTTESFIVAEDPGSFAIETDVEPENGATYTVTVEECGQAAGGGDGGGGGGGGSADDDQYDDDDGDVDDPDDVVPGSGDDDPLPDTGGAPLLFGAAALVLGAVLLARRILVP